MLASITYSPSVVSLSLSPPPLSPPSPLPLFFSLSLFPLSLFSLSPSLSHSFFLRPSYFLPPPPHLSRRENVLINLLIVYKVLVSFPLNDTMGPKCRPTLKSAIKFRRKLHKSPSDKLYLQSIQVPPDQTMCHADPTCVLRDILCRLNSKPWIRAVRDMCCTFLPD